MGIFKAWKYSIWDESIPVGPAGMMTSIGEIAPTLACFSTINLEVISVTFPISSFVKTSKAWILLILSDKALNPSSVW